MKVLIVEDDIQLAEHIKGGLMSQHNVVETVDNGAEGSFMARSFDYDAIILDNSLPKKDGLTVCKEIRNAGKTTPVMFLTVDDSIETKVLAFKNGADDYVAKPFSMAEIMARLKAINNRLKSKQETLLVIDDLELDTERQLARRGNKRLHLTRKEYCLLEYFMKNRGIILSRALIMEHVWTADSNPFSNTVESHLRNLRAKLNIGKRPNLIKNVPGRGYVMDDKQSLKHV